MNKIKSFAGSYSFWGHVAMVMFVFMSVFFYKERLMYYDSAYQFFKFVNSEWFNIEAARFSTVIPQALPWLAIKAGFSLKVILVLYSMSFALMAYAVYVINVHVLKNMAAGLAILLVSTLCVRDTFFYCVTELPYGILFSTLFFAWIFYPSTARRTINPFLNLSISLFIILVCFFYHPMTLFSVGFVLGFYCIDTRDVKNKNIFWLLILIVIVNVLKMTLTQSNSYEGNLFSQLKDAPRLLLNLHELNSTRFFASRLFSFYLVFLILSVVVGLFYLVRKNWLKLLWFSASVVGFLLVCFVTFNKGDSYIAMEKYFMPLSFFLAVCFLHDVVPGFGTRKIWLPVLLAIATWGVLRICKQGAFYSNHIQYIDSLIDFANKNNSTRKLIVKKESVNAELTSWACPTETLLRSTSRDAARSTTVYISDGIDIQHTDISKPGLFLCAPFDLVKEAGFLNPRFFSLPDQPYVVASKGVDDVDTANLNLFAPFHLPDTLCPGTLSSDEFTPFMEVQLSWFKERDRSHIDIVASVQVLTQDSSRGGVYLVISMDNGLYVSSPDILTLPRDSSGLVTLTLMTRIKDLRDQEEILKVYLWNKNKQPLTLSRPKLMYSR